MGFIPFFFALAVFLAAPAIAGETVFHRSGLLARMEAAPDALLPENAALNAFFRQHFGDMPRGVEWRQVRAIPDATHIHLSYALYAEGRRVVDRSLRVHYNRGGWVEYATSHWDKPFRIEGKPGQGGGDAKRRVEMSLRRAFEKQYGRAAVDLDLEPVLWLREGEAVPALEVSMVSRGRGVFRHFIADEATGQVLEEKPTVRYIDVAGAKVYKTSPLGITVPDGTVTLRGLTDLTGLLNSVFHVVRSQDSTGVATVEIDPTVDYSAAGGFTTAPGTYDSSCTGTSTQCPNQGFDGINVYYHLSSYRTRLDGYLSTLGATITLGAEPLLVVINQPFIDVTPPVTSNNAAYVAPCESGYNKAGCFLFLRPEAAEFSKCGGTKTFYDLAREAGVIVHEYQHYITDALTHMEREPRLYNVGDALHEGYSDYFALSHVTADAGQNVTKILDYGFQECPAFVRDLATLRIYKNDDADADPHDSGLTWASGLWQLRTELGGQPADLLVLKSQLFLSTKPGFVEAVEALVKADKALHQGVNVARIRSLFYSELNFLGGKQTAFRDPANLVAEVGFKSCAAAVPGATGGHALPTLALFAAWLVGVLTVGRRFGDGR